ncbi:MAG: MFS transporter [Sphingobium sp.]|nr:MFS transporter [Sphingobium sp.]
MAGGDRISIEQMRRYGRMNILAGFLIWGFALAGISMIMPIMYNSISQDMGWTIGETTRFMAIKAAVSAFGGLFAGSLFVKFGIKRILVPAIATVGTATTLLYFVKGLAFYYSIAAVTGFASILCLVAIQITLAQWYSASLGRITAYAMLGGALAGAIIPMSVAWGLRHFDWHATAATGGIFILVVLTTAMIVLVRESPTPYGYSSEELDPGNRPAPPPVAGAAAADGAPVDRGPEFKSIVRTPQFALLLFAVALSGAISNGVNEYIPLFIERQTDLGAYTAAMGFTIILLISGLSKIIFGWLFDRFSTKGVALCWAICGVAALLTFPVSGFYTFLIFTIVRGLSHGGIVVQTPILARHIYGVKPLAQVISLLSAAFYLGTSAGIAIIGVAVDVSGGFTIPFLTVAGIAFVAALLALRFKPKYWFGYQGR